MKTLILDILFPSKFSKWRIEEIKTFILERNSDILVFKLDQYSNIKFDVDWELMRNEFQLDKLNILIFDKKFNYLNKYNKKIDGTKFNGKYPGSYLFTREIEFNLSKYSHVHHIFLMNFTQFNQFYSYPIEQQSIHLYPGGGLTSKKNLEPIPRETKIISTQRFTTEWLIQLGFQNHIELLGGFFMQNGTIFQKKIREQEYLTVCFASMGHAKEKGEHLFYAIIDDYKNKYPNDKTRFVTIGNTQPHPLTHAYGAMSQSELDNFYHQEIDVLISLDTGIAYNGWPLGIEALLQGVVLITTDMHKSNLYQNYTEEMIFIGATDKNFYTEKIKQLHDDRELLRSMAERGQSHAILLYSYQAQQAKAFAFLFQDCKKYGIDESSNLYADKKLEKIKLINKNQPHPKLTIAIPAYKPTFFEAALQSALSQDFDDFEVLICDDCRSDEIQKIVEPYLKNKNLPKIRYIYNKEQLGEINNCSKCLELAEGEYFKFLFDDDILLPGALSAQVKILDDFPGVSLVSSRRKIIDENGLVLSDMAASLRPFKGDFFINGPDLVSFLGDYTLNFIGEPPCVMFRRAQILPEINALASLDGIEMYWIADLTVHIKLLRLGHLAMLEEPGACFRISTEQTSHISRNTPNIGDDSYKNFSQKIRELGWYRSEKNHLVRMAPLDAPLEFKEVDLLSRVKAMLQGEDASTYLAEKPISLYENWTLSTHVYPEHALFAQWKISQNSTDISVLITQRSNTAHLEKTGASIAAQFEAASAVIEIAPESNTTTQLQNLSPGWAVLLCAGDTLESDAILLLRRALVQANTNEAVIAYFDHDEIDTEGKFSSPHLKPAFNADLLLSYPYMGRALAVRTEWAQPLLEQADGVFDLACAYRLMLQALRDAGPAGFVHVPAVLAHLTPDEPTMFVQTSEAWQRLAQVLDEHLQITAPGTQIQEGPGPGTFHAIYPLERTPLVSIIVPTRDQLPFLSRCIDSLLSNTDYPAFEILIVDNDSQTPEAREFLAGLSALGTDQIRVLSAPGQFNFSRMNNLAVAQARGEFILLLNNDTAALQPEWLGHMVRHALRDGVGIVGARLLYPDGKVQHAGVIMGLRGPAEHPCLGLDNTEPGYLFRAQVTQNFSAVTAACMLVSKAVYEEVGGLDEVTFGVSYNDIDFCLRVGQTGRRIVWTPLATLLHEGSASQKAGIENKSQAQKVQRFGKEQEAMYLRWPAVIANDPAYNPNLSLVERGYEIETNPLLCFDKFQGVVEHRIAAFAADNQGCGNYRMLQPLQAMLNAGLCTGGASPEIFSPNLALRSGADTLIFQRPNSEVMLANLKALTPLKGIKKIYEVDDHLARVPIKSAHYEHMPKDLRGKMLKAIGLCDRLVVSTEPLARELRSYNGDVRVVLNRIPPAMWGAAPPQRASSGARAERRKPKVGWAGGVGHLGDLEMITGVIKDLADTVDWVFFGMCPDSIRPYVREFHTGIPTLEYPHKLMELAQDWDLAIAPLESNPFNDCKSNLKLLEYGWCGVPVVCSDVLPYQCDLPATRVKNRHKNWREAILERVTNLEASRQEGLALQQRIATDWMLTGDNLQRWYQAWTD